MNNSSAPLPSLRQIWPPGVPWIPACAGMTKGDAVSLPPRRRGTGSRARTSSPRRRGSRKTPGDHPRVGARPSFERERRSHVPTKAARPKGDGRARRAQPPAFAGAVPRLRGGRPEAKHCFAKRERADTDVGPRGCTGIIIAAGRQRQQPIEAAGATFQMARVYLAPTLGCRFRGSGNTPVGNATRSTMPVPSLNSDLIGSPPWPVGKGVNHRRRGCPHPSRRLSRSRW